MKRFLLSILRGAAAGVALNSAICMISSYWLKLGYYAPCFVGLEEPCGGELNGALVQACAFALAGALIAALLRLPWKRAFLAIALGVLIAGILVSLASLGILHTFAGG